MICEAEWRSNSARLLRGSLTKQSTVWVLTLRAALLFDKFVYFVCKVVKTTLLHKIYKLIFKNFSSTNVLYLLACPQKRPGAEHIPLYFLRPALNLKIPYGIMKRNFLRTTEPENLLLIFTVKNIAVVNMLQCSKDKETKKYIGTWKLFVSLRTLKP